MTLTFTLIIQLFCTFSLTGLIWVIQCVHYPAFRYANVETFKVFHNFHSQNITWIVAPLMVSELLTATLLFTKNNSNFWLMQLVLILLLWTSTAFLSVPLHNKLMNGYDLKLIHKLTITNWPRTLLWSLKSALLVYFLIK